MLLDMNPANLALAVMALVIALLLGQLGRYRRTITQQAQTASRRANLELKKITNAICEGFLMLT